MSEGRRAFLRAAGKLCFLGAAVEVLSLTGCGYRHATACGYCTSGCTNCTVECTSIGGGTAGGSTGGGPPRDPASGICCVAYTHCKYTSISNGPAPR